jgi:hypothetical protein
MGFLTKISSVLAHQKIKIYNVLLFYAIALLISSKQSRAICASAFSSSFLAELNAVLAFEMLLATACKEKIKA